LLFLLRAGGEVTVQACSAFVASGASMRIPMGQGVGP